MVRSFSLPSLDIPCKYYYLPNITFIFPFEVINLFSKIQQCFMVSVSSDKPAAEFDRMAFKDELKRSVLMEIVRSMIHPNLQQQMATRRI